MTKGTPTTERPCPFCKKKFSLKKAKDIQGELHCPFCRRWVIWLPALTPKRVGEWLAPQIARFESHFKS